MPPARPSGMCEMGVGEGKRLLGSRSPNKDDLGAGGGSPRELRGGRGENGVPFPVLVFCSLLEVGSQPRCEYVAPIFQRIILVFCPINLSKVVVVAGRREGLGIAEQVTGVSFRC